MSIIRILIDQLKFKNSAAGVMISLSWCQEGIIEHQQLLDGIVVNAKRLPINEEPVHVRVLRVNEILHFLWIYSSTINNSSSGRYGWGDCCCEAVPDCTVPLLNIVRL